MDTSETYIKMCEKAEEIQGLRPNNTFYEQEFTAECYCDNQYGVTYHPQSMSIISSPQKVIWLPRQDQLQEIYQQFLPQDVQDSSIVWVVIADDFHDWIFDTLPKISFTPFVTMEQLWFAFVMEENHNKVWSGTSWVKQLVEVANAN